MVCGIAMAAARDGARVELVGRIGDDADGDSLIIALAHLNVGHAALLRDPARPTGLVSQAPEADEIDLTDDSTPSLGPHTDGPELDPADVTLGLQYVSEFGVVVAVEGVSPAVLAACVDGAGFAEAHLVAIVPSGASAPSYVPAGATVLEAPDSETTAFADLVGRYAAGLDRQLSHDAAFEAAIASEWERDSA
jgi:hypothetical protein